MIDEPTGQLRILSADADQIAESDCACAPSDMGLPVRKNNLIFINSAKDARHAGSDCACTTPDADPSSLASVATIAGSENGTRCAESDCACATADLGAFDSGGSARAWSRPPDLYLVPLPGAHTLAFNPQHPGPIAVLNGPARRLLDDFAQPSTLAQAGSLLPDGTPDAAVRAAYQLADLGLLAPFPNLQSPISNLRSTLTAWLQLTNACNLNCAYCYVAKSAARMDEATGRAAVDSVFGAAVRHGYRAVKLKYAGGEPTLNFGLVRTLHEHAADLATRHGLELHEVLLSNGVALTSAMLNFLKTAGIRLMISLDGLGATHDRQRPLNNGRPSSGLVLAGLDRALAHGPIPHISVTVSSASAAGLAETTSYLLDRDLPFNWNFVRDALPPARDWQEQLIADLLAAVAVIEARLPRRRLIDGLLDRSSFAGAHAYPCGAGRDYLAIGHHGTAASCHMALAEPVSDITADDLLSLTQRPSAQVQNVAVDAKESCRACTWRYVCAGGCPWLARRVVGWPDSRSPYCAVYRALIPALLRLEGQRILKWQDSAMA